MAGDLEDLDKCTKNKEKCSKSGCVARDWCVVSKDDVEQQPAIHIVLEDGREWFRVQTLAEVFDILKTIGNESYMLVAGNTAKGKI